MKTILLLSIAHLSRMTSGILNNLSARSLDLAIRARQAACSEPAAILEISPPGTITRDSTIRELQELAIRCGASYLCFESDRITATFSLKEIPREHFRHSVPAAIPVPLTP